MSLLENTETKRIDNHFVTSLPDAGNNSNNPPSSSNGGSSNNAAAGNNSASSAAAGGTGSGAAGGRSVGGDGPIRATAPMWRCSRIMHMQRDLHPTVLSSLEGIVDQV